MIPIIYLSTLQLTLALHICEAQDAEVYKRKVKHAHSETLKLESNGTYEWHISGDLGQTMLTGTWNVKGDTLKLKDDVSTSDNVRFFIRSGKLFLFGYGKKPWMKRTK
ncbi:MAG: hypothetical protein RIB47_01550 [Cyclobacteriaceae bacterium]